MSALIRNFPHILLCKLY